MTMDTFQCIRCGKVFRYGNRRTPTPRANWRKYVLRRHERTCEERIAGKEVKSS